MENITKKELRKIQSVKVVKNFKDNLKKLTSIGSLLGGLAVPLSKMLLPTLMP